MKKTLTRIICLSLLVSSIGCADAGKTPSGESPVDVSKTAIENVVDVLYQVFGVELDASEFCCENRGGELDLVYTGNEDAPSYYGYTDSRTGSVKHIGRHYDETALTQAQIEEAGDYSAISMAGDWDQIAAQEEAIVTACTPVAIELIERVLANGRTVLETQVSFVGTDSVMEPCAEAGISVRMSEGECYTVTVLWPQLEAYELSFYPEGWESCIGG